MSEQADTRTIQQRMIAVMQEVGHISKGRQAPSVVGGYKFRGIDDFLNALQPAFIKHGIVVVPQVQSVAREERPTKNGGVAINTILTIAYEFHGAGGDNIRAVVVGEGADSTDKGCNKAMSSAFKYLACQSFCIPTDEPELDTEANVPHDAKAGPVERAAARGNNGGQLPKSQAGGPSTNNSAAVSAKGAAPQGQSQTAPANSNPAPAGNGKANTQPSTTTNGSANGSNTAQNASATSAGASQPDPKSTGTTPSSDTSGTTESAGAQGAADPKSAPTTGGSSESSQAAQSQSSATATVGKTEMQQLLQAGTANGWQKHQLTEFICHAFKLTPQTMTTDFTFKLWEQAVRILSHPKNANGVVSVSASGQPLGPEHRWPQD